MGILGGLAVLYLNRTNKLKSIILRKNFRPIKVIFTAHGWAFNEDRPYWQKVILKVLHKKTISLSDTTIAVAEVVKNQVVDKNNYNKIVTIYNGVEKIKFLTKKLSRNEISMRANVTFDSRARWVGTISELHRNKGLIYAIEAIKNIKKTPAGQNIKFFIIGEGEERTYLEKMISDYNLKNDVFLLGHINNASQFLKAFDIFMLTSTTEALPYVLLEAGLAGLPVIATRVGGIPEIIDDEKDGLLSRPKDAREISAMLEYIISSKEKSKRLSNNIKEKIIRSFSIKECVGKTEELYRELIK